MTIELKFYNGTEKIADSLIEKIKEMIKKQYIFQTDYEVGCIVYHKRKSNEVIITYKNQDNPGIGLAEIREIENQPFISQTIDI